MTKHRNDHDLGWVVESEDDAKADESIYLYPTRINWSIDGEVEIDGPDEPVEVWRPAGSARPLMGPPTVAFYADNAATEDSLFFKISQDKGLEVVDWDKIAELKAKWDEGESTFTNAYAAALWYARNSP